MPDTAPLHELVREMWRLARALPLAPLREFEKQTRGLPRATEAERLVVQRVGQDVFRAALMDYWGGRCAVTGCAEPLLLRASHIKPWALCATDAERLDVKNGLLLAAHLDAAFDCGLIDFDAAGQIRFAERFLAGRSSRDGPRRLDDARQTYPRAPRLPRLAPRPPADRRGNPLSGWLDRTMEHGSGLRRRFVSASRPAKRKFEPNVGRLVAICLILKGNSNGYRIGPVNSHGESWLSERHPRPAPASGGEQPGAENGRIPALFRADPRAERLSPTGVLAEEDELSSNPLCMAFQWLRITYHLMNLWQPRILQGTPREPMPGLKSDLRPDLVDGVSDRDRV